MKKASQQAMYLFIFIVSLGSSASNAGCSQLQGVTLCDNGDRELVFEDVTYTSRAGDLSARSTETGVTDLYSDNGYYRVHCHRQNITFSQAKYCYSFPSYNGDLAGQ